MSKIRVLNFPMGNSFGGITRYALENGKYIDKNLFQYDYAAIQKIQDTNIFRRNGSDFYQIACYPNEDLSKFQENVNEILKNGYDIVHIHTRYWDSFQMEELAKNNSVKKIIVHAHTSDAFPNVNFDNTAFEEKRAELRKRHYEVREKLNTNTATDFWACSNDASEWLYGDKIPNEKILIMKNAINTQKYVYYEEQRNRIRKAMDWNNKFIIGHVGRFGSEKNHSFLIDVLKAISKEDDNVYLVLVGEGPTQKKIVDLVDEYKLNNKVMFLGKREDVNDILQGIDLFCLPSLTEGFPISLVEAQTADVPCIVSENITPTTNITGNVMYEKLEIENWVKQILKIKNDKKCRKNMYDFMTKEGFNIVTQIKRIEEEYKKGIL